jgi:hypothetical protein
MFPVAAVVTMFVSVVTFVDWRKGLLAVLLIGVLQDVLRKLTPGVPAYFILWAMGIYLVVVVAAVFSRSLPSIRLLFLGDRRVELVWALFLALIAIQLVNAAIRFGNLIIPAFGIIFYFGPAVAMLVGASFANREWRIGQFLRTYVVIFVPTALTVYLSPGLQDSMPVLREVGSFVGRELIIYDVGTALLSYSGLLRVGEIASWHAATAAMFLSILALNSPSRARRMVSAVLIVFLIGAIFLTGRRKMLMALSIFFIAQWAMLARFRRGTGKLAVLILLVGTLGSFSFSLLDPASESNLYVKRGTSVFSDVDERLSTSLMLMNSAFNRSSGIGLGAGAGSQGAQYAGVDQSRSVGGSAESGIGKLMVELGVPGILITLAMLLLVGYRILKNMKFVADMGERYLVYQVSFSAFMFANMMTFTVATQVYGDLFILILMGTIGGFILKINEMAIRYANPYRKRVQEGRDKQKLKPLPQLLRRNSLRSKFR